MEEDTSGKVLTIVELEWLCDHLSNKHKQQKCMRIFMHIPNVHRSFICNRKKKIMKTEREGRQMSINKRKGDRL